MQPDYDWEIIKMFGSQIWAPHGKQVRLKGMESLSKTAESYTKKSNRSDLRLANLLPL